MLKSEPETALATGGASAMLAKFAGLRGSDMDAIRLQLEKLLPLSVDEEARRGSGDGDGDGSLRNLFSDDAWL